MTDKGKDLSVKIMEALKPIIPTGAGFIMLCGDIGTGELGVTCNVPDDIALELLRSAILTITTEPAESIEPEDIVKKNETLN
jgi:hypothetical protein